MVTGKINSNVGHSNNLKGNVRELDLIDQLQQVVNLKGVLIVNHPVHGVINVSNERANELLSSNFEHGHLLRFKRSEFDNQ